MHVGESNPPTPSLLSSLHVIEPLPKNPVVHAYEQESPKAAGTLPVQVITPLLTAAVGTAQVIAEI